MYIIEDVYGFFCEHKDKLANSLMRVAAFPECGVEIYITAENGYPSFQVDVDGKTEYEETASSQKEAEVIYRKLVGLVVDEPPENTMETPDDNAFDPAYLSEADVQRHEELNGATRELLEIFIGVSAEDAGFDTNEISGLAANIAYMLSDTYGLSVKYPIVDMGDDGAVFVMQYPFEPY